MQHHHSSLSTKIYQLERRFSAVAMGIMGTIVFFDVLHRFWTRSDGLFAGLYGGGSAGAVASQLTGGAIVWLMVYGALRTRGRTSGVTTAAFALGIVAAGWLGMEAFVRILPNGLVWSQTLGLVFMLWVACIGASLATYEHRHLALDLGAKVWPKKILPFTQALGNGVTALFCLTLGVLAIFSIRSHYGDWHDTGGAGGIFAALPVPKWIAFLAMPTGFFIMAARFFAQTLESLRGVVEEDDPMQMLGLGDDTEQGP